MTNSISRLEKKSNHNGRLHVLKSLVFNLWVVGAVCYFFVGLMVYLFYSRHSFVLYDLCYEMRGIERKTQIITSFYTIKAPWAR